MWSAFDDLYMENQPFNSQMPDKEKFLEEGDIIKIGKLLLRVKTIYNKSHKST